MTHAPAPAVCQLDDCGIQAIGRCVNCGKAFCASHQARWANGTFVDQCSACQRAHQRSQEAYEREYGKGFIIGGAARKTLLAAQVPTVNLLAVKTAVETKRFGRSKIVETIVPLGRGWLLGAFPWRYNDGGPYGGSEREANFETMLLDRSDPPARGEGGVIKYWDWGSDLIVRVQPTSRGCELLYTSVGDGSFIGQWLALTQRVRQLAGIE